MLPVTKDCEVEVSYEKNGFKGVWYKAILEETPTKSKRKLLRVRYTTSLKQEDGPPPPLTKLVDQSLIRPVPPKDVNDGEVFEEGSVVNADRINSWWTGLVVKRKEDDKYLVYFESPPNIIEFERKQLRAHLDWTGWKWVRPENNELSKSVFSSATKVELRRLFDWRPAMIIKEVENGKSFIVKLCNGISETVDSRIVRPKQPFFSVGEYELLDHVEVFDGSVWRDGVVRGIVYEGRYIVSFGKAKVASAQFNHSDLRPPMEWEDGIWHKRPKTRKGTPADFICYSRKRKRGEVDHNSNLNSAALSSDRTFTVVEESAANVEDTQDTPVVLPFAKKSPIWKLYEAMEVFRKVPQSPHFSPLIKSTSEDFREGSALGMMASFSGLLEKLKDLETEVNVSQLDSLKDSFTKLDKYGFDVTRPLSRISKLLALKDRQLNVLEKRKCVDKERMDEYRKRCKAELEFSETERKMVDVKHKILELQRQEAALKEQKEAAEEQKDVAYRNVCQMESCARVLDVELEGVEFDFETMLSAPW